MRSLCVLSVFSLALGCVAAKEEVGSRDDFVVYGNDDRVEVYQHPDLELRELAARSIVALMGTNILDVSNPSDVRFRGQNLQQARRLCTSERFLDQPAVANCSGTLIDLDLVLTAGHCVTSQAACEQTSFIFDYYYEDDGPRKSIDLEEDVYSCAELVTQELGGGLDYAVVRLDRVVHPDHGPAPVRMGDQVLPNGTDLVVMGFGSGLPLKIDDGGQVTNARSGTRDWFGANLDTFGGHSGSGVFNDAGEVVGVLVRGEGDYEYSQGCGRVRVLPENPAPGIEEECTYVARAIEGLCGVTSSIVCEGSGVCQACRTDMDCGGLTCDDGACVPSCATGEECPSGTLCTAGLCQPTPEFRCDGNDVLETRCGRTQGVTESCGDETFCDEGACVPLPAGDSCETPIEVEAVNQTLTGEHVFATTNTGEGTCGGNGRDTVYAFELEVPTRMVARGSNQDAVLHLRSNNCSSQRNEIACNDDAEGPVRTDSLLDELLAPGRYFLFMDNFSRRNGGPFELILEFSAPGEDAGPGFDAGPREDVIVVPRDAGPGFDSGPGFDAGPGFDSGPGFDTGPGFDAGPRTDAGPPGEIQNLQWGCDCGVANSTRSPPLALLLFAGLFVMRRRRLS